MRTEKDQIKKRLRAFARWMKIRGFDQEQKNIAVNKAAALIKEQGQLDEELVQYLEEIRKY